MYLITGSFGVHEAVHDGVVVQPARAQRRALVRQHATLEDQPHARLRRQLPREVTSTIQTTEQTSPSPSSLINIGQQENQVQHPNYQQEIEFIMDGMEFLLNQEHIPLSNKGQSLNQIHAPFINKRWKEIHSSVHPTQNKRQKLNQIHALFINMRWKEI